MNNKIKIAIGLGLLGIGGFLYWKSKQAKANFLGIKSNKPKNSNMSTEKMVGYNGKKNCPKGYTENSGLCLPKDITKTVIPATLSRSNDSIFVKDGLMPVFGRPIDLQN